MCELFLNLFLGLIAGLISGFIVYRVIEYKENKKWQLAKKQLAESLNGTINRILTSVRIALGIKPPIRITNDNDFIIFINKEVLEKFDKHKIKIEYLSLEKRDVLLSNFRALQDSLRQLSILFISFRAANPWYTEKILELQKKIYNTSIPYVTFPELSMSKYNNNSKLQGWRKLAVENIYELCKFAINIKNNQLIRNLIDEDEK